MPDEPKQPVFPLTGTRVIDYTQWLQGPVAAMMLADLGAEVIHLERRLTGDLGRGVQHCYSIDLISSSGNSMVWEMSNRNKKSVAIDPSRPEGVEILHRLVKKSQVFVTNYLSQALRKFGADRDTLRRVNPDLVYASGSCFGQHGPDADMPGFDLTGLARSGLMMNSPLPGGEPVYLRGALLDQLSATMLAFGIVTALLAKERLKISPAVHASQLSAAMWLQHYDLSVRANLGYECLPVDRKRQDNPLYNHYCCQDGKWIALGFWVTDRFWPDFCEVMDIKDLEKDPRFYTEQARKTNCEELISILDRVFAGKAREEWADLFKEKRFPFSVVNSISDLLVDPQASPSMLPFESGFKFMSAPFDLEGIPIPRRGRAPEFGEHTEEVLLEVGGYTWEEIESLRKQEVI